MAKPGPKPKYLDAKTNKLLLKEITFARAQLNAVSEVLFDTYGHRDPSYMTLATIVNKLARLKFPVDPTTSGDSK